MNEFNEKELEIPEKTEGQQTQHTDAEVHVMQTQQTGAEPQTKQVQQVSAEPQAQQTQQSQAQQYSRSGEQVQQSQAQQYSRSGEQSRQPGQQQSYSWMQNRQQHEQQYGQPGQQNYRQPGPNYQQTAWGSQPHYNYYQRQQTARQGMPEEPKKKTGRITGKHWGVLVAMALVFGLIAGTVAYGINRAADTMFPGQEQTQPEASAEAGEDQEEERLQLTVAGSETSITEETPVSSNGDKTVAEVTRDAMPSLVTISTMSVQEMRSFFGTQQYEAQGAGTGVIVGENDTELLIATNNHVIEGAQEVSIGFIDETVQEAQIKGTDSRNDLAIVAVKLEDIPEETISQIKVAVIGDSDALVLGDQVVAIGNALGVGQSVTSGYVSALNRELDLSDGYSNFTSSGLIQTDAAINSGNSGGALLNMKGELIGINEAKSAFTSSGVTVDNVGYAIPMSKAQPILEELMNQETREKYSEEEQGYLGVSLVNVGPEFAELYGTPEGVGFAEVAEGSPAAEAGALKGDILTEFNGKEMTSVDDVMDEIRYYRSGEEVELTVLRADNGEYKEVKLTVTLGTQDAISTLQTQ